jgi:diguanylate cyclase (GGDEF)-like protein
MYVSEKQSEQARKTDLREDTLTMIEPRAQKRDDEDGLKFARELFDHLNADECMKYFLNHISNEFGSAPAVYFKYVANRRVLMAMQAVNMGSNDWNGVGVNFNDGATPFRVAQLRQPEKLDEIRRLIQEVFGAESFLPLVIDCHHEIQGVVFLLNVSDKHPAVPVAQQWNFLFSKALGLLEAEKRLHSVNIMDPQTDLLNREQFLLKVQQEVSRSRRTLFPVSIAIIALDQFGTIVSQLGPEEAQPILRMVARIFEKHSRVNDVWGRTGLDEFAILMPHTGREGAMIKAERLRRIIESADFGRVLSHFSRLTISLGVCEYPSMVRDSEELIQAASEALDQVRSQGNKACVANPPEGFVADFQPREKGS